MAQINKPNTHFNPVLYTGTGATNSVTSLDFQPDLIWSKSRTDVGGYGHFWQDSIRGVNKRLMSNSTAGENTLTNTLDSFDSNGFTMGADSTTEMNKSGSSYVAWNWKAGGTASTNTDGTITSSVSANTDSGFSVVTYTGNGTSGSTIGHGLTSVPSMIIVKRRNATNGWGVYHKTLGTGSEVYLNLEQGVTNSNFWITTPTTSVFSVSSSDYVNTSSDTFVAYCFAEKKGFSKFGSYTGNGSTDGTFVYTGFKPAMIIQKNASTGSTPWFLFDNKRNPFNKTDLKVNPNSSDAESAANEIDMLSNGFKVRTTGNYTNGSGNQIIYMAFAENPLVGTNNIPATAR